MVEAEAKRLTDHVAFPSPPPSLSAPPRADGDGTASPEPETPFLSTLEGEITFFRSLMRARPVGIHRHFHVLTIRNWILRDTQVDVPPEDIWAKLRTCYNLDELEALVRIVRCANGTPFTITAAHRSPTAMRRLSPSCTTCRTLAHPQRQPKTSLDTPSSDPSSHSPPTRTSTRSLLRDVCATPPRCPRTHRRPPPSICPRLGVVVAGAVGAAALT